MKEALMGIEDIYLKYKDSIFSYLYYQTGNRAIAEELCQEAFLRAFKAFSSFEGRATVKTWLYSIAYNLYASWYKREIKYEMVCIDKPEFESLKAVNDLPDKTLEKKERMQLIMETLKTLKADYRNVLILSELQELSYAEIANAMNWSLPKVKSTLYRARIQFKVNYSKEGEDI